MATNEIPDCANCGVWLIQPVPPVERDGRWYCDAECADESEETP